MRSLEITVPVGGFKLRGNLNIPDNTDSIVIFSHGSGSSRFSPRNQYVAEILNKKNIATLLVDLLTEDEDQIYGNRFNIEMLAMRLLAITNYIRLLPEWKDMAIGYFGASTGAASALQAAAQLDDDVRAVVCRGGRPDLAASIELVKAPVLLIVGSLDPVVIELNERAYALLHGEKRIEIVKGASHLFEEPGKLDAVAALAADWFEKHLLKPKAVHAFL
ncbi:MAG TPA: alpha/beta hydrolase [Bacteroidia bacterium]|jgi:pimeloyl-ACP methyl ester carboxylesterase